MVGVYVRQKRTILSSTGLSADSPPMARALSPHGRNRGPCTISAWTARITPA